MVCELVGRHEGVGGWRLVNWSSNRKNYFRNRDTSNQSDDLFTMQNLGGPNKQMPLGAMPFSITGYPGFDVFYHLCILSLNIQKMFPTKETRIYWTAHEMLCRQQFPKTNWGKIQNGLNSFPIRCVVYSAVSPASWTRHFQVRASGSNRMVTYYGVPFHE